MQESSFFASQKFAAMSGCSQKVRSGLLGTRLAVTRAEGTCMGQEVVRVERGARTPRS